MVRSLRVCLFLLILAGLSTPVFCQDAAEDANAFGFGLGLGIGISTFNELNSESGLVEPIAYQSISLSPDLSFGKFGIGLAVQLNYRFVDGALVIRTADWVPADFQDFLKIYLAKFAYVRWGMKGDPLFIKAGSFTDATLGNGFIMANYDNTLFLPDTRIFGLAFDLDGALFNFPYVGLETMVGNLAVMDVMGGRLYVRPLAFTSIPVIKNLEVGGTLVVDTRPDLYEATTTPAETVMVFGGDLRLPILTSPAVSLVAFTDVASIDGHSMGGALGFGGKLFGFLTYGAQARYLGPNFIPTYFDPVYDILRASRFDATRSATVSDPTFGWFATLGTSFLDDKIIFSLAADGPLGSAPYPDADVTDPEYIYNFMHVRGVLSVAQGIIPGFSFDASYDKSGITAFADLINPADAAIKAQINYKTGPAVLSFIYMIRYAPGQSPDWIVTTGLQSSIQLF